MNFIFPSEFLLTFVSESTEQEKILGNGDFLSCALIPQTQLLNT